MNGHTWGLSRLLSPSGSRGEGSTTAAGCLGCLARPLEPHPLEARRPPGLVGRSAAAAARGTLFRESARDLRFKLRAAEQPALIAGSRPAVEQCACAAGLLRGRGCCRAEAAGAGPGAHPARRDCAGAARAVRPVRRGPAAWFELLLLAAGWTWRWAARGKQVVS